MDGVTPISSDRPVVLEEKEVHEAPMEAGFSVLGHADQIFHWDPQSRCLEPQVF